MWEKYDTLFSTLQLQKEKLQQQSLRLLFQQDKARLQRYHLSAAGLSLNFAKHLIDEETLACLLQLAQQADIKTSIKAMFSGEAVNNTEKRAALHTALRQTDDTPVLVNGHNVISDIKAELLKMSQLIAKLEHSSFTDVVNLGIGGSDLGPRMVVRALKPYATGRFRLHFVANIDGMDLYETLKGLNPAATLFIIASKSFTTQETLLNAQTALEWLKNSSLESEQDLKQKHFIGITANPNKALAWGINGTQLLQIWDFVGGRYSLWSSMGLSIALSVGMDSFKCLLNGAATIDQHFLQTDLRYNMPVLMALLSIWYQNFWQVQSHAILAYDQTLEFLPQYLQQADMESNGKRVDRHGIATTYQTGAILWGGIGTNGQHAYHQLLHQGTVLVPADFIMPLQPHQPYHTHHQVLLANYLAQSEALAFGKTYEEAFSECEDTFLAAHKVIPGNKPHSLLLIDCLTPERLGALIALYEHKILVQSLIWNINAFDQWGVELGKQLADVILQQGAQLTPESNALSVLEQTMLNSKFNP